MKNEALNECSAGRIEQYSGIDVGAYKALSQRKPVMKSATT
jgi:hypothetical protein